MKLLVIPAMFTIILIASIAAGGTISVQASQNQIKRFSSYEELESFLKTNHSQSSDYYGARFSVPFVSNSMTGLAAEADFSFTIDDDFNFTIDDTTTDTPTDFSTTNIQIEGVDEPDIVKSDGEYIYIVSGSKIFIINAYPAEDAKLLSKIEENGYPTELFINGDKLVVLGWTHVRVYDVSDREAPVLVRDVSFNGYYFDSRMIGDYVYVIVNSPALYYTYTWENSGYVGIKSVKSEITLPEITVNGNVRTIKATEIYFFDAIYYSCNFTTIIAINIQDEDEEIATETILTSTAHNIFVSSNNIYITYTIYSGVYSGTEKTVIHKIAIADGEIEYKCWGKVPGRVLNQFSMDEYQGYFRIATTTGNVWNSESNAAKNHVYVLGSDLNIVGRLEDLAPTERIYSARFMGDRAYLVTFRRIDPLFVLDLSDPENPTVLGELEIPGYSDYLHPYDETHIIGIGRDDGVKIALFDVSDPENPVEISKYEVGNSWSTRSQALTDHRAFLFSRSKNLLVMPIGRYYREDAHVFSISPEDGITLRGTITHQENNDNAWSSCYCYYSNRSVKRSLYIDNVLYTISDGLVKMNNLEDLSEINSIELQTSSNYYYPMIG